MVNREEYERIVALYADVVFRVALSYAKTKEDAEDVLQNVFLKLLTKRVKFEDDEHIRKWLIRVAVNECNSLWSSFWRKNVEYIDRMEEGITFQNADYSDLYDAIKVLPAKLRICLLYTSPSPRDKRHIVRRKLQICFIFERQRFAQDLRVQGNC